jgi:hypothetical protein
MSTIQETTILNKIRSRGYWKVVIRPTTFEAHRVPLFADLFPIVRKNSVRLRVWDYPHVDSSRPPQQGTDWVGQEYDRGNEIEVWRFYQSGLFVHFFSIAEDWLDHSTIRPGGPDWSCGQELDYSNTIDSMFEIYEFASRLALSPAGGSWMCVEIEIEGLAKRRVTTKDILIPSFGEYRADAPEWKHRWEGTQIEIIAEPRRLAALAAQDLFARFGLNVGLDILSRLQQRMGR